MNYETQTGNSSGDEQEEKNDSKEPDDSAPATVPTPPPPVEFSVLGPAGDDEAAAASQQCCDSVLTSIHVELSKSDCSMGSMGLEVEGSNEPCLVVPDEVPLQQEIQISEMVTENSQISQRQTEIETVSSSEEVSSTDPCDIKPILTVEQIFVSNEFSTPPPPGEEIHLQNEQSSQEVIEKKPTLIHHLHEEEFTNNLIMVNSKEESNDNNNSLMMKLQEAMENADAANSILLQPSPPKQDQQLKIIPSYSATNNNENESDSPTQKLVVVHGSNGNTTNKLEKKNFFQQTSDVQQQSAAPMIVNNNNNTPVSMADILALQHRIGFTYTLDAPTACKLRKNEDSLTYINKDIFYGLSLEYRQPTVVGNDDLKTSNTVTSIVMVDFRGNKLRDETLTTWNFWYSRHQMSEKLRIIDIDPKVTSGLLDPIPIEVAHNAVGIRWSPINGPAYVMIAIRCLSTDFSTQKGVKGIPLNLQIDTSDEDSGVLLDRAYCQIKVFCDKGAERKSRGDEKRLIRDMGGNGGRTINCQASQPRTVFSKSVNMDSLPVYFTPGGATAALVNANSPTKEIDLISPPRPKKQKLMDNNNNNNNIPPKEHRIMIYVRQENEDVFTPLHVTPPSVLGLVQAITSKYQIDSNNIRYLYRRDDRGIIVKIDDDMLKYYCNEDAFMMKVLAFEEKNTPGSFLHDIVLVDLKVASNINEDEEDDNNNNNITSNIN